METIYRFFVDEYVDLPMRLIDVYKLSREINFSNVLRLTKFASMAKNAMLYANQCCSFIQS